MTLMDLYELDDTKQLQTCDAVVILSFKKLDYVPRLDRECTTLLHKVSKAEKLIDYPQGADSPV